MFMCLLSPGKNAISRGKIEKEAFNTRGWPRYCRKVYWTKMVQNGPDDHLFGQYWPYSELDFSIRETKADQNGPFRSANRTIRNEIFNRECFSFRALSGSRKARPDIEHFKPRMSN